MVCFMRFNKSKKNSKTEVLPNKSKLPTQMIFWDDHHHDYRRRRKRRGSKKEGREKEKLRGKERSRCAESASQSFTSLLPPFLFLLCLHQSACVSLSLPLSWSPNIPLFYSRTITIMIFGYFFHHSMSSSPLLIPSSSLRALKSPKEEKRNTRRGKKERKKIRNRKEEVEERKKRKSHGALMGILPSTPFPSPSDSSTPPLQSSERNKYLKNLFFPLLFYSYILISHSSNHNHPSPPHLIVVPSFFISIPDEN